MSSVSPNSVFNPETFARELDQLSLQDLHVLTLISSLGSVSAAAEAIKISQPSASYSLDKMRRLFRDDLFTRQNKTLVPTDMCERVSAVARTALRGIQRAGAPTDVDVTDVAGDVTVLHRGNNWRLFDKLNTRFLKSSPHGRLLYTETHDPLYAQTRDPRVDSFLGHQCDFYIGASRGSAPEVRNHVVTDIPCMMVFNPDNVTPPTTPEELSTKRFAVCWIPSGAGSRGLGTVDRTIAELGLPPRVISFASLSISAIAKVLKETDLIYTGAIHSLPEVFKGLQHAPLPFEVPPFNMSVRWLDSARETPLVSHAIDLAVSILEEEYDPDSDNLVTTPYE